MTYRTIEGSLQAEGFRIGIVVARFNAFIGDRLVEGSLDCLVRHGVREADVTVAKVPGAWEIPLIARKMARSGSWDGIICLGAVIRGSTPHFEYVAAEASKGIAAASLETDVPISFGVLTTDSIEQAIERAGTKAGNSGWNAALGLIEMISLSRLLEE
ncbi:MAG: 6,7-dimethyl-8-ribityllumazine synthase [Spirochaetaceae bacterium]|nr:MAG: 6,7-dimethyl-8-ribityllumazine synthase [Spirochaetaceae bacterium]